MAVALEDKFDEVRQLIVIGKEKGYLLYDEVNDLLPADLTANPEDLEELLAVFAQRRHRPGRFGKRLQARTRRHRAPGRPGRRRPRARPDARRARQDQRSRPHVPARDGHRAAAHARGRSRDRPRIERGKLSVIKSISRMPAITKAVIRMGDQLARRRAHHPRAGHLQRRRDHRRQDRGARAAVPQAGRRACARRASTSRSSTKSSRPCRKADKRKYRRARWKVMRAQVETVALHPQDRVHRAGQAPPRRRGEGHRRARLEAAARARQASRKSSTSRRASRSSRKKSARR